MSILQNLLLFDMVMVFFLQKKYMHLLFKNGKNTQFLKEISFKNFKSLNGLKFNSCVSISYTIKNFTQKFHSQP